MMCWRRGRMGPLHVAEISYRDLARLAPLDPLS